MKITLKFLALRIVGGKRAALQYKAKKGC